MKLTLNSVQRNLLLEILNASKTNALNGQDFELAQNFAFLSHKVAPLNATYVDLNRNEADILVEFCEIVKGSLDKAIAYLDADKVRDPDEVEIMRIQSVEYRDEINSVAEQLLDKIRQHPV